MNKNYFSVGKVVKTQKPFQIDLPILLESRLLVQSNSRGGKSYFLRKLLEQTHGKVQQIVIDIEGEYSTLREKFDYLLVGQDGDIPIQVRSAELLAKKLLETKVSAILDLYELKSYERISFVKNFLEAMIDSKKHLWHPVLVIVDEAHIFCPEAKSGQAESTSAVIELASRGGKRGYCAVLATQRPAKLHKDASAECNNKFIGRASQDIDMKRGSAELGFTTREQMLSLRKLKPGEFYAFGTAIFPDVQKVKIDKVQSTHPESGSGKIYSAPQATDKIKNILKKLVDLPQKAEEELKEKKDFVKKINELKSENRKLKAGQPKEISKQELERIKQKGFQQGVNQTTTEFKKTHHKMEGIIKLLESRIKSACTSLMSISNFQVPELPKTSVPNNDTLSYPDMFKPRPAPSVTTTIPVVIRNHEDQEIPDNNLGRCEKSIYSFLVNNPHKFFDKKMVGLFTNYSPKSGGFNNSISRLNSLGVIKKKGHILQVTTLGIEDAERLLGNDRNLHKQFTINGWIQKLPRCSSIIFKELLENPEETYSKEHLGEITGYAHTSGGFNNSLSQLASLGLIVKGSDGIKLNSEVLQDYD